MWDFVQERLAYQNGIGWLDLESDAEHGEGLG